MDIVLFGIQGSGKGTLGKMVADKYEYLVFETGGELRKLSGQDSELGKKVKSIVEAGRLVPNEVVMDIIENFMKQVPADKDVLFDGLPRKMVQAETFDALMEKLGRKFTGILIDVPEEVVMKRLMSRRICENCKTVYPSSYTKDKCEKCDGPQSPGGGKLVARSDDNPESIKTRIKAYYDETTPVIEHYKKQGKMLVMNGDLNIDDAAIEIFALIDKNLKK